MKYLFVRENGWIHGANLTMTEMADYLRSQGDTVDVINPYPDNAFNEVINDQTKSYEEVLDETVGLDFLGDYDIVIANEPLASVSIEKMNIGYKKLVLWVHNDINSYRNNYKPISDEYNELVRRSNVHILTTNPEIYHQWESINDNLLMVTAPIDVKVKKLPKLNKTNDIKNYVFTGSARKGRYENKGVDYIIKFIQTKIADSSLHFTIVGIDYGTGTDLDKMQDEYPNQITLLGHIDRDELLQIFSQQDLFISTSKYEATQRIFIECMKMGTLAISRVNAGSLSLFGEKSPLLFDKFENMLDEKFTKKDILKGLNIEGNVPSKLEKFSQRSILEEWNTQFDVLIQQKESK